MSFSLYANHTSNKTEFSSAATGITKMLIAWFRLTSLNLKKLWQEVKKKKKLLRILRSANTSSLHCHWWVVRYLKSLWGNSFHVSSESLPLSLRCSHGRQWKHTAFIPRLQGLVSLSQHWPALPRCALGRKHGPDPSGTLWWKTSILITEGSVNSNSSPTDYCLPASPREAGTHRVIGMLSHLILTLVWLWALSSSITESTAELGSVCHRPKITILRIDIVGCFMFMCHSPTIKCDKTAGEHWLEALRKRIHLCSLSRAPSISKAVREALVLPQQAGLPLFLPPPPLPTQLSHRPRSLQVLWLPSCHPGGLQIWIMFLDLCLSSCPWLVLTLPGKAPAGLFLETKIHYTHPYWFSLSFAYSWNAFPPPCEETVLQLLEPSLPLEAFQGPEGFGAPGSRGPPESPCSLCSKRGEWGSRWPHTKAVLQGPWLESSAFDKCQACSQRTDVFTGSSPSPFLILLSDSAVLNIPGYSSSFVG